MSAANIFSQSPHTLFTQQVEIVNHNRLFIDNLVQEGVDLHDILNKLHMATELDTLEIRINSGGGFVKYGQQLINVMKDKFNERCVTILDSEASSMAALMFMAGDQKVIYPHSVLMVHDVSMWLGGKANETRKQMDVYLPVFKTYFLSIFGDTMTPTEVEQMFEGRDFWFNALEMCKRGMADSVIVSGAYMSAEDYLKENDPEYVEELTKEEMKEEIIEQLDREKAEALEELEKQDEQ
jgi:ATP-dependent protease ClpP protease subunit